MLGIIVTRAAALDPTHTTVHLACAALRAGVPVALMVRRDLEVDEAHRPMGRAWLLNPEPEPSAERLVASLRERTARRQLIPLTSLQALLLRVSTLDATVLAMASWVQARGVFVVNAPAALIAASHKGWLATCAGVPTPRTRLTASLGQAHLFHAELAADVVVKPALGSGGHAVARVGRGQSASLDAAFHAASRAGDGTVILQAWIPGADQGEKRLVWFDGEVLGGYLRRAGAGEFRHNLRLGAVAEPTEITPSDLALISRLTPHLKATGVRMAGLDLMGDHLLEVNVLNPGGAFHADRLHRTRIADSMVRAVLDTASTVPAPRTSWPPPGP